MSTEQHTQQYRTPPAQLAAMLDVADAAPGAAALRQRSYELLGALDGAGGRIVDVGCGAGRAVGELLDAGADAEGVDADATMLALARERRPEARFREGDVLRLPYGEGTLDGYRADKLYHALPDPAAALAEARRVLVPGRGRICLLGQDWEGSVIEGDDPGLTRALVLARASAVPSPRVARGYRNLLLDGGFHDVHAEAHTVVFTGEAALPLLEGVAQGAAATGEVSEADADRWRAEQRRRAAADRLFLAIPIFVAAGRAPGA